MREMLPEAGDGPQLCTGGRGRRPAACGTCRTCRVTPHLAEGGTGRTLDLLLALIHLGGGSFQAVLQEMFNLKTSLDWAMRKTVPHLRPLKLLLPVENFQSKKWPQNKDPIHGMSAM